VHRAGHAGVGGAGPGPLGGHVPVQSVPPREFMCFITLCIMRDPVVLVQTWQVYERGAITRHVEAGRVIEAQGLALQVERDAELAHMLEDGAVNIVFSNPEEEHAYWHVTIRHPRCPLTQ